MRFVQRPVIVMIENSFSREKTEGGIWIDNVVNENCRKNAFFHIKVKRGKPRKFAYPLLDYFIKCFEDHYDYISSEWGKRDEQDDPAKFFMNNGFKVRGGKSGGIASLDIKNRPLIDRVPLVSFADQ